MALCSPVCEGLDIRKLLTDLSIHFSYTIFYEENQRGLVLFKNPANNRRVQYIDLKFNFVYQIVQNSKLAFEDTYRKQALSLKVYLYIYFNKLGI